MERCQHDWEILTRVPCRYEEDTYNGKMRCRKCKEETYYEDKEGCDDE